MIPIQQLLSRIRWDTEFAKAEFAIGYYDRLEDTIIVISIQQVHFEPENHFSIGVVDEFGTSHMVPLHRVRQVFRNGERIWERK